MRGYIIYDATTGELRHHGTHSELPEPIGGGVLREIAPEECARIPPARGKLFVAPPATVMMGDLQVGKIADVFILDRAVKASPLSSPESSLEKAIRENTEAVKAMTERLDKLFSR